MLEWQVKVLADRLAIAVSLLEDAELEAFCGGEEQEMKFWEQFQEWLVGPDEPAWRVKRKKQRKNPLYEPAMQRVRKMITDKLRAARLEKKRAA